MWLDHDGKTLVKEMRAALPTALWNQSGTQVRRSDPNPRSAGTSLSTASSEKYISFVDNSSVFGILFQQLRLSKSLSLGLTCLNDQY